jgi:hypothetical protein
MRVFLLFVFFTGIFLIVANQLVKQNQGPVVQYRYLSRDLDTYLREETLASAQFSPMFLDEDPTRR